VASIKWQYAVALVAGRQRSWVFSRDPDFATKAGRVLDL
jgi:hypothetical protein